MPRRKLSAGGIVSSAVASTMAQPRKLLADVIGQPEAIRANHVNVGHHDVGAMSREDLQRLVRAFGSSDAVTAGLGESPEYFANRCFVVHDEN